MSKKALIVVPIVLVGGFGAMMFMGACAIGAMALVTVGGIAGTYYALSDKNTKEIEYDENFSFEEMGKKAVVDSFDYTTSDNQIKLAVTENDLNNIIYWALGQVNLQNNQYLKKVYVDINGHNYDFYADLDGKVIKSRAKISTTLKNDPATDSFVFTVEDIKLGKIGGIYKPAISLFDGYIDEDEINNFLAQTGLALKFKKENYSITYKKSDLLNDLKKMMGGGETNKLLFEIVDTLSEKDVAHFDLETNNFLECNIYLNKLEKNELVTDDKEHLMITAQEVTNVCKNNVVKLVNSKIIPDEESTLKAVFSYLLRGYAAITDEQRSIVDQYNYSSIGIPAKELYVPAYASGFVINNNEAALFEKMQDRIMGLQDLLSNKESENKEVTLLYESDLNMYIASRDLSSSLMLLYRYDNSTFKMNYMVMDNFYCNIYKTPEEQLAELVCKLNINGYHTSLTFETNAYIENNEALTFKIKDHGIRFGDIEAENINEELFKIFATSLNSSSGSAQIEANAEEKTITVKFTGMINDAKTGIQKALSDKAMENIPSSIPSPYKEKMQTFVNDAINSSVEEVFDQENAEIVIDGESRDVNGSLELVLKENNFKTSFAKAVKDAYNDTFTPVEQMAISALGFNIDDSIDTLLG